MDENAVKPRKEKTVKEYEKELAEMEKSLPVYWGDGDGNEPIEMTPSEWKKYNNMRFVYKDTGKEVIGETLKIKEQLLREGIIEPRKEPDTDYIGEENPKGNLPTWF